MFDTTKADLKDSLRKVDGGKRQLPDFQRDYVWGAGDAPELFEQVAELEYV